MSYYKVVIKETKTNKFYSSTFSKFSEFSLTYIVGVTTFPQSNTLGIFVFSDLELARKYIRGDTQGYAILEGDGVIKTPLSNYIYNGKLYTLVRPVRDIERIINIPIEKSYNRSVFYTDPPDGTVLLSEFTPRRIVE